MPGPRRRDSYAESLSAFDFEQLNPYVYPDVTLECR